MSLGSAKIILHDGFNRANILITQSKIDELHLHRGDVISVELNGVFEIHGTTSLICQVVPDPDDPNENREVHVNLLCFFL